MNPRILSPFANWACEHPYYDIVFRWLMDRVESLSEPALFLICGPTGVGKSTLSDHLTRELALRMKDAMEANPDLLHKVYAEAVYIPGRGFDWDGLFRSLLRDASDILIDRKVSRSVWPLHSNNRSGLEDAVNQMLLHRKPRVCIIDEGGAFLESGSDETLLKIIGYLKSLSNRSRTHFVILGDYRLAKMTSFSGQLNRRCLFQHFANYPSGSESAFQKIVADFERRMRECGIKADITPAAAMLFEQTCGCVGLLKRSLEECWITTKSKGTVIDTSVLESTRFPKGAVEKWRAEIKEGYRQIQDYVRGHESQ